MTKVNSLRHEFVEFIPSSIEPGVIYVSLEYNTSAHLCACGCGTKVVLPIHPTDWRLTYDGKSITMRPSVGNWGFECRSHYLITNSEIHWAGDWTDEEIAAGRSRDLNRKSGWYGRVEPHSTSNPQVESEDKNYAGGLRGWLDRFFKK